MRSSTAAVLTLWISPTKRCRWAPVDHDATPRRGEQLRILAGNTHRIRSVGVDQVDQFPTDVAEQHHPCHVEHLGVVTLKPPLNSLGYRAA